MAVKVVGKQYVDFANDKGERIEGIKLHIVGKDKNVVGESVFTQFIMSNSPVYDTVNKLAVNSDVVFVYDRKGKVDEIIVSK